jgi:NADH-quinone oxidoreductase subunit G
MDNLAEEMENAQVLYIIAADPAADDENLKTLLKKRYDTPDNLTIVQDVLKTKTADLADVILAAQAQVEREGTFTSGERRVQRFYPVTSPKGQSLADFEIVARIGANLGIELKGRFPSIVFPMLAKETPGYEVLDYRKLAEVTEQWPLIGLDDLYYGGTGYKNDQGLGVQLNPSSGEDVPPASGKATMPEADLIAVPVTTLYDRGTTVVPSKVLDPRIPTPFLALNPVDAQKHKATDGMTVSLQVNESSATVVVKIEENIPVGFALVPRSMGISIVGPTPIEIRVAEGEFA